MFDKYTKPELSRRGFLAAAGGLTVGMGLAACANDSGGSGGSGTKTLTLWGNHPEWADDLNSILRQFESETPGIKIEAVYKPLNTYASVLNTALTAGTAPDLIGLSPGGQVTTLAASGQINDLTGKVSGDSMLPQAQQQAVLDGKVWGAPLALPAVGNYYRPSLLEKVGVKPPTNGAEFLQVLDALKAEGITVAAGGATAIGPYMAYTGMVSAILGVDGFQDFLKGRIKLTDAKLLPATEFLSKLGTYFQEGWLNQTTDQAKESFVQGRSAIVIGGTSDLAAFAKTTAKDDIGMFPHMPPPGVEGKPATLFGTELIYTANSQTKYPDEAAQFIAWLATPAAQQLVADRLSLPTIQGVTPNVPLKQHMLEMSDVQIPVWFDRPETNGTFPVFAKEGIGTFTGRTSPAAAAAAMQATVRPSA
ncbi:ABC transporter substrate-binding protein [Pseudarthrobacter sp. YAF2]|uniref:ABC transporter substrate-binding protein n=1 Tax=Pseudarthrobacter sp. YAF2 TaxID=3233078 RepID=UPI003F9AB7B5